MAQHQNRRRSGAEDHSGRRVLFYVPGEPDGSRRWRRDSARYVSSSRRSHKSAAQSAAVSSPAIKPIHVGLLIGLAFLLIIVAALVGFVTSSSAGSSAQSAKSDRVLNASIDTIAEVETIAQFGHSSGSSAAVGFTYNLDSRDLLAIPNTAEVMSVDLEANPKASTPCRFNLSGIKAAMASIENNGHCGFVFVDVNTGHSLVLNAAEEMYVASAAKAPYIYWLLSSGVELDEFDTEEVEWIVTESDNDSYDDLFMRYYSNGYEEYMRAHNVSHEDYYADFYPRMNARSLASIWAEIFQFIQGGSEPALLLGAHLATTETSFIRDGLSGTDAIVLNKAGWIDEGSGYYDDGDDESTWDYASVSDAAIIQADGHVYLMVIATSQPDSDEDEANVSALARALYDVRGEM